MFPTFRRLLCGFAALTLSASAVALDMKDKDLLLYFSANKKGEPVKDDSGHKNDGVIAGGVDWTNGKFGTALAFKEQGEVAAPYIPFDKRSFTVCMWVYPELAGGAEQCVFSQTQVNAQNTSLHYRVYTNGTVRMGFYSNDLDAPAAVKAKEWAHIVFWLNVEDTLRRIYINGKQVAQDKGVAGIHYLGTAGNTMVGSWGATGQKFNGLIDEVQVWNRALSEKDIQESMQDLTTFAVRPGGKLAVTFGRLKGER